MVGARVLAIYEKVVLCVRHKFMIFTLVVSSHLQAAYTYAPKICKLQAVCIAIRGTWSQSETFHFERYENKFQAYQF